MPNRILVIDDVQDTAETLAALLRIKGHEVRTVTDPRVAVDVASSFRPALVLLDIGMPYINGYQLCPMLKEALKPTRVPIIAVTAWGSSQDKDHSRAVGFDAHLVKPLTDSTLDAAVDKFLPNERGS